MSITSHPRHFNGLLGTILLILVLLTGLQAQTDSDWYMAGANPQRTSWVSEEVRGELNPLWYRPFEAYISQKIQPVAVKGILYLSTAEGLYALNAENGDLIWFYATPMPLGHSPTVFDEVAYVGCFDKKVHAINALTGQRLWTFSGGKGFQTNPLLVDGVVYAGNRDGTLYALDASSGDLLWKFSTDGPILFSSAYQDDVVFFASNDSHAYAVDSKTGSLVWKSQKLPGSGFHSWWPVVQRDSVIFSGSHNYKFAGNPGDNKGSFHGRELKDVYPNHKLDPRGTPVGPQGLEPGDWVPGTRTIDCSKPTITENGSTKPVTEYFEEKPWRRTYFVLDRISGGERSYDFDEDGRPEYAPILWAGDENGNRYPPVVGGDGVLYQQNNYLSDPWIAGGNVSGWKIHTPFISVPNSGWNAVDEPTGYAAGGDLIYWSRCCDRIGGAFDLKGSGSTWGYYSYDTGLGTSLGEQLPGYDMFYHKPGGRSAASSPYASFGANGVYGWHSDMSPPIPHRGRVYVIRSNCVIAFGNSSEAPVALPPILATMSQGETTASGRDGFEVPFPSRKEVAQTLEKEVELILDAGHLRPAYISHGAFDLRGQGVCGDDLSDYWHNVSETIHSLVLAYPHLSNSTRERVKLYLEGELETYPPWLYNHIGWSGRKRETYITPPDIHTDHSPKSSNFLFVWRRNPFAFYALWKYAELFGDAARLFEASRNSLEPAPDDEDLLKIPHALNAFIGGYLGYLKLEALAGYPETARVRSELERLTQLRLTGFTKNSFFSDTALQNTREAYCRTLNVANNFLFLVPELALILRTEIPAKIQAAVDEYTRLAPFWFVSNVEEGFAENAIVPVYDSWALFQVRALLLRQPYNELARYLDVPSVARGDLYYIQNLVTLLESRPARRRHNAQRHRESSKPR